jgi:LmbE family N-acetylglucosaminyl deacetylase
MEWVYLAPHFDDVAFSCGGLLWEQTQSGDQVSLWTICAGDPPSGTLSSFADKLHTRWDMTNDSVRQRRIEDQASSRLMGAVGRHFEIPDCIYRRSPITGQPYYPEESDIFGNLHPEEADLVDGLATILVRELPKQANLVSPLGLGDHVDHTLVRLAAEKVKRSLWYYADYPYVLKTRQSDAEKYKGMEATLFRLTEKGVDVWQQAVAAYASQISSFWPDVLSAKRSVREYYQQYNGVCLWKPVKVY